jgi:hypothetical protein
MAAAALAAAIGVAAGQAQSEPVLLKQELEHLDSKMTKVIDDANAGTLSGSALADAIKRLQGYKHGIVVDNFVYPESPRLFGVTAADVILLFDQIDVHLDKAKRAAAENGPRAAIAELEKAVKKELTLKKKFEDAGQAPDLVKDLAMLTAQTITMHLFASQGSISRDSLESNIHKLAVEKARLIGRNFSATLFGVSAADVIYKFSLVDGRLTLAIEFANRGQDTAAVAVLKDAKKDKHELQEMFAAAASCSQPKVRGVAATAAACPPPSVTLNCPPTATLGGELAVSGSVTPAAAGESVAVAFTPPSESPFTEPATTNTAGDFTSSTTASTSGTWKTQAFEGSIASPPCYTTVGTAG